MAGDLMFAHAEYHSTYPLPICGTICGGAWRIAETPKSAIRKVTFARDSIEDLSTAAGFVEREQIRVEPKAPRFDRYKPFLSSTWETTKEIPDESGLHPVTVNKFLRSQPEHVEKKAVATEGGYSVNYWKLK